MFDLLSFRRTVVRFAIFLLVGASPLQFTYAQPVNPLPGRGGSEGFRSEGLTQLVLDPQGFRGPAMGIAVSPDDRLIAAAGEKEIRLWDVQTGQLLRTLRGDRMPTPYGNVYGLAFSPDGRELVVGVDDYSEAGSIRVYDLQTLEINELVAGHGVPVRHVQFSRDGRWLASAGENGKIFLWDWPARKHVGTIEPEQADQPIYDVLMFPLPAPVLFVVGYKGPAFYSVPQGRKLSQNELPREASAWLGSVMRRELQYPEGASGRIPNLWHIPLVNRMFMTASTSTLGQKTEYWVSVWTAGSPQPSAVYRGHPWNVMAMTLSPSGRVAASTDKMGEVHVWDPRSGRQIHRFRALGYQFYDAALSGNGELFFASTNYLGREFRRNHYGPINFSFDLKKRRLIPQQPGAVNFGAEQLSAGNLSVELVREGERQYVASAMNGRPLSRYRIRSGRTPMAMSVVPKQDLGIPFAAVWGDELGGVELWNAQTDELRRVFAGHDGFISSVSATPNGKLLVTGSTDRTLRLWSLSGHKPTGKFDFDYQSDVVIEVRPGSSSEQAGVHVGDRVLSLDGKTITEIENLMLLGKFNYRPGQQIPVVMERGGRKYSFQMTLIEGPDFAEPQLSAFVTREGEWILWTPHGYYDASPGAERFIGWQVNRGPALSAEFYSVGQFKNLYRPDIIDQVLEQANAEQAIVIANGRNPKLDNGEHIDLRQREQLDQVKPPRVKILEPVVGSRTTSETVHVRARIETDNDLPIEQVTILINGRPAAVFEPNVVGPIEVNTDKPVQLLSGINEIAVIASNSKAKSDSRRIDVTLAKPEGAPAGQDQFLPSLYVLAIGVSKFANDGQGINNLDFAAKDAQAFTDMIYRNRGKTLFKNVECHLLMDEQATRTGIIKGFDWLRQNVTSRDVAVVFVSSHGLRDEVDDFYLAGHDVDLDSLPATGVSWQTIKDYVHKRLGDCKRIMFVDTCHAGGIAGAKGAFVRDPLRDLTAEEVGAIVYASSTPREKSFELKEFGHGAFTKAILSIVEDKTCDIVPEPGGDGLFDTSELELKIADRVKQFTQGRQHPVVEKPPTLRAFPLLHLLAEKQ